MMNSMLAPSRQASALRRPLRELWLQTVVRFSPAKAAAQVPAPKDPAREAAELRAMAWALPSSEGGFKADLLAAADRHENRSQR